VFVAALAESRDDSSTISLGSEREVLDLVANSIMGLWDVVNDLTRLRPTQREHYRRTILVTPGFPRTIGSMRPCATLPKGLRLHQFVLMSDAFIVMPGGIGTLLEAMMIWHLLQVGHLQKTPLILVGKMYAELVAWCRQNMLRPASRWPVSKT
jgi:hypothetical protein